MLKCTKFYFGRGSAPELAVMGELTALPRPLAGFKGPTSKRREGREREGKEMGGAGREKIGRGGDGRGREGRGGEAG